MRDHLIRIDSHLGKKIGLTSANFESAIVWDCRPAFLGITLLRPREPQEQILNEFFRALDGIYTPVQVLAPTTMVKNIAEKYGYENKTDPAGSFYITNLKTKNLAKVQNQQR
jgi:hypothetical protein